MKYARISLAVAAAFSVFGMADAQNLTLEECSLEARPSVPNEIVSDAAGDTYYMLSGDGSRVERYDYKTGKKVADVMVSENLRDCDVEIWDGFIMSPDEKLMLLYTDVEPVYRNSFKASYYVYDIRRNNIKKLSENGAQEIPAFSPDSRMVAFVRDNNVFVAKLDYGTEIAVTKDGEKNKIINGVPDWVYQEEFGMLSSLAWSPDNLMLAFIKWDESEVPTYGFPLYKGECEPMEQYSYYPGRFEYKYPVAGETNSTVKVVSYDVETRALKTMNVPLDSDGYINKIEFGKTPERLMVNTLNRNQNEMRLYAVNPRSAIAKLVYTDKSDSWIDPSLTDMTRYYDSFFVVASERDGYRHLYQYSNAGALMKQLTKGEWEVTDFYGYDPVSRYFYFQSTQDGALNRTLSYVNAKGEVKKLSEKVGTNSAAFSNNMKYFVRGFSDVNTPNIYDMCNAKGKKLRTILDNAGYAERFSGTMPVKEFFTVTSGGHELNGYMIKPRDFDASKKYPVIMYQYSGPGSQLVLNRWELDWLHYAAQEGYVVVCVDGRGTGGRGKEFASVVYKQLGKYESIDQVAAAKYVASLPYVDSSKIGIFGWSYGGYETLMAMTQPGNNFAAGVAVAPVTDWRFYDTIYSERFMRTPQQNESGYEGSSAINRIGNLEGRLLIVTGTADDNVHASNTFEYVAKAVAMNKMLDMMVYPNKNHHINGCQTRFALYSKILDFFDTWLKKEI